MTVTEKELNVTIRDCLSDFHPDSAKYLLDQSVRIGRKPMNQSTSAKWAFGSKIVLNSHIFPTGIDLKDPMLLSTIAHEIRHLQQGPIVAFSVYGELDAWQLGFQLYYSKVNRAMPTVLSDLMALPLVLDRSVLKTARKLMLVYAGKKYRIDLYPLFPITKEIRYLLGFDKNKIQK
jgi:hypothetical protein